MALMFKIFKLANSSKGQFLANGAYLFRCGYPLVLQNSWHSTADPQAHSTNDFEIPHHNKNLLTQQCPPTTHVPYDKTSQVTKPSYPSTISGPYNPFLLSIPWSPTNQLCLVLNITTAWAAKLIVLVQNVTQMLAKSICTAGHQTYVHWVYHFLPAVKEIWRSNSLNGFWNFKFHGRVKKLPNQKPAVVNLRPIVHVYS